MNFSAGSVFFLPFFFIFTLPSSNLFIIQLGLLDGEPGLVHLAIFSLFDLVASVALSKVAGILRRSAPESGPAPRSALTFAVSFLNPMALLTCASLSLASIDNALVALSLWACVSGLGPFVGGVVLGGAVYAGLYPVLYAVPLALLAQHAAARSVPPEGRFAGSLAKRNPHRFLSLPSLVALGATFAGCALTVAALSFAACGMCFSDPLAAARSLVPAMRVILTHPELTPNVGMFWYLSIEVFEFFRPLFLFVFHYQTFFYVIPLRLRVRDPALLFAVTAAIIGAFRSYPTLADLSLTASLYTLVPAPVTRVRFGFLSMNFILYSSILRPVFYHLWIAQGTGNANFYWAACVAYTVVQSWLISGTDSCSR